MQIEPGTKRAPKKYRPGAPFLTFFELLRWLESGGWVYWPNRTRPVHPSVILSLQCRFLLHSFGRFTKAIETEAWLDWEKTHADV